MKEKKKKNEILYLSFNKDKTCLSLGMRTGYRIYDLTKKDSLSFYERICGKGIGIIEMLEKTNILGLVGGGDEPLEVTNKLIIYDKKEGENIAELTFKDTIVGIRIKKDKILVVLNNYIYLIETLNFKPFDIIELGFDKPNKQVIFSFTLEPDINYLGYCFNNNEKNKIIIKSYDKDNKNHSLDLKANYKNNTIITCMEFDREGKLLAVSEKNNEYLLIYAVDNGIPICKCNINNKFVNSLYISFEEDNEFLGVSLDSGEIVIFNIKSVNYVNYYNQNEEEIKENVWSRFYLPEKKAICAFTGYEIGKEHIICIGTKGNYYLAKFDSQQSDKLALKINEKYILKPEN